MIKNLDVLSYDGEGAFKCYINEKWAVAVKNYKPQSGINNMDCIERHGQTDELFVPTVGECILVIAEELDGKFTFKAEKLENGKIYNVKQGVWHNAIMNPDTKVILVEKPNTGLENTEIVTLNETDVISLRKVASEA